MKYNKRGPGPLALLMANGNKGNITELTEKSEIYKRYYGKEDFGTEPYTIAKGIIIDDFLDETSWVASANMVLQKDTTNFKFGANSIKATETSSGFKYFEKNISKSFDGEKCMSLWVYKYADVAGNIDLYVGDAGLSNYKTYTIKSSRVCLGWNYITIGLSDFTTNGTIEWSDTFSLLRISCCKVSGEILSFDLFQETIKDVPKVCFTFDDILTTQHTNLLPVLIDKDVQVTLGVISDWVGGVGMTLSQLLDFKNQGSEFSNHTNSTAALTSLSTEMDIVNAITECNIFMIDNNLSTQGKDIIFYPNGLYDDDIITICKSLGLVGGRGIDGVIQYSPMQQMDYFKIRSETLSPTLETNKTLVDEAEAGGNRLVFYSHDVTTDNATMIGELIDYIKSKDIEISKLSDLIYYA